MIQTISHRQYSSGSEVIAARAALRKRLFAPRIAPQTREEALPAPMPVQTAEARPVARVWTRQHDAHVMTWIEWKTNPPLFYIKDRCREIGVSFDEVVGGRQFRWVIQAKHRLIAEVKAKFPHMTLPAIGRLFGGLDHTTVLWALNKFKGVDLSQPFEIVGMGCSEDYPERREQKGHYPPDLIARIRTEFMAGLSYAQIGRKLGTCPSSTRKFIKRRGWTR